MLAFVSNRVSPSELEEESTAEEELLDNVLESIESNNQRVSAGETFTSTIWLPPGGVVLWQVNKPFFNSWTPIFNGYNIWM